MEAVRSRRPTPAAQRAVRFASVCSGIEAASVAWEPLGWRADWLSEIDPHACSVLAARFPETVNLGDMTKIDGTKHRSIDLLVGGTPCQSFSIAGDRAGLDDDRGNLTLEFLRLARETRARWVVWENVPGVLSIDEGRAFGAILGRLAELGYGFAYRILDAQYVRVESHPRAVPQRRRRVFVIGYLGNWTRAAAVLFERESLRGGYPPRRTTRAVATTLTASRIGGGEPSDNSARARHLAEVACTLDTSYGSSGGTNNQHINAPLFVSTSEDPTEEVAATFTATGNLYNDNAALARHLVETAPETNGIRRITPLEAERLMGFPDHHTAAEHRGKPMADGPRYRLLGNSMAVNVVRWIGERIAMADRLD